MWTRSELLSLILERDTLIKRILDKERRALALPEPKPEQLEPAPKTKPKPVPGSQEWFVSLPLPTKQGISMNDLARSVPKPRPLRRPSWER